MAMKELTGPFLFVGSPDQYADIQYLTGFRSSGTVVLLVAHTDKCLVVPRLELGRARGQTANVRVLTPDDLRIPIQHRHSVARWALAVLRVKGIRCVSVPGTFPVGIAQQLQRAGVRVSVARRELVTQRRIKTAAELRKIKSVQQSAVIAMRVAVSAIAAAEIDGKGFLRLKGKHLTSEMVRSNINTVLLQHGSFCRDAIVAGGAQSVNPHEVGTGPLRAHEPIVIDIFPQHLRHGYWGDITRTVVRGSASPELRRIYHAVRAAQSIGLNCLRPRVAAASVHKRVMEEFERRGFKTGVAEHVATGFIHSTGHGVGLEIHEAPSLSRGGGPLSAGNVVTVEPGLYYPSVGGVRIEDTVVVTPTGWRYLAPCEKKFEV